jgi:DNA-binding NarL/FixJ family response regulator
MTPGVSMRRPLILIGDDHRLVAEGLEKLLQADYDIAEIVEDGWALVAAAERLRPDLILADITMPLLNGLDACEKIVKRVPGAKVVVLTMHHDAIYAVRALRSGAAGFVLKNSASLELLTAVKTVLDGATYLSPQMVKPLEIFSQNSSADVMDTVTLTPRQREVLQLFAEGHSAREVAEILHISVRTAENHKAHIMNILGTSSTAELIRCALRLGLISN